MAKIQRLWSTKRQFRILAVIFGVALIYLLPFFAVPGFAAIYLKIDGIAGESMSQLHPNTIELSSVQFGVGRSISSPAGGATRTASPASVSEITVTKTMDKASVPLFKEAVIGQVGKNAVIYFTRNGFDQEETYYEIGLTNVLLSGFTQSSGGDIPSESLSLNFTKIGLKYTPYSGGKAGTPVSGGYDLTTSKGF